MKIVAWVLIITCSLSAVGNAINSIKRAGKESVKSFIAALLALLFVGFGICYLLGR